MKLSIICPLYILNSEKNKLWNLVLIPLIYICSKGSYLLKLATHILIYPGYKSEARPYAQGHAFY